MLMLPMPAMQALRVYRPRIAIHGCVGMGQEYIGAAALHHLEGYHIQSLELGTLMGDSTRVCNAPLINSHDLINISLDCRSCYRPSFCRSQTTSAFGTLYTITDSMVCNYFRDIAFYHTRNAGYPCTYRSYPSTSSRRRSVFGFAPRRQGMVLLHARQPC